VPTRRTWLTATLNGVALANINSAACTYSWKQNNGVPTATVYVRSNPAPGSQLYDQTLNLTMGANVNNLLRFVGLFRGYSYALWPRALGLTFQGRLIRAAEFQNRDNSVVAPVGGLLLFDLLGAATGSDAVIVQAVLTRANVGFTAGTIQGTGATFGTRAPSTTFLWRAGTSGNPFIPMAGAGESALAYIQEWDKVSAVYTGASAPVGFYRTYETVNGIRRSLIGGRPRNIVNLTFTEGIDIEQRSRSTREYPIANAVFVTGFDPGLNIGPVRNMAFDSGTGGNTGTFLGQSSNPFQPSSSPVTQDFGSPFIEWGAESEAGVGMNAERVGNALLADLNRETVTAHFRTPLDVQILPGYTILVRGPGGQPAALGIGENLWVDTVTTGVAEDGEFYQDIDATGGGTPDPYTPAPAS
jgi:hypothetical protein